MTDTKDLIEQLLAAKADQQRELLLEAFEAFYPEPEETWGDEWSAWFHRLSRFRKMLDAEAYESAALMLVPEGWRPTISQHIVPTDYWRVILRWWEKQVEGRASKPALAIVIAALRARNEGEG